MRLVPQMLQEEQRLGATRNPERLGLPRQIDLLQPFGQSDRRDREAILGQDALGDAQLATASVDHDQGRRVGEPAGAALLAPRSADCPRGRWMMAQVRRHDTRALLDATAEAATFNSTAWLGGSECPAAVIVTTEDRVVSPFGSGER